MRSINLEEEKTYENLKVSNPAVRINQDKYYYAIGPEFHKFEQRLSELVKNRSVLEIGCSVGGLAEKMAPISKEYLGIDISDKAVALANEKQIKNANFLVSDAHKTDLPSESFDIIVASGVLHHLDLENVLNEVLRILKPNALIIAKEPLGINPILNFYRNRTPSARTNDEKPLTKKDLEMLNKRFTTQEINFIGLTSILSVFLKSDALRRFLLKLDSKLSTTFLKFYFWYVWGVWKKEK